MDKGSGFTIIELIVVIAIIAALAAIVLVNVTSYINKSKDTRIKSNMANIAMGMAVCYASVSPNSYVGCGINTTYVPANLATDIRRMNGGITPTPSESVTAYCISSPLASSSTLYACIDSTGVTKTSASAICTTLITACPD